MDLQKRTKQFHPQFGPKRAFGEALREFRKRQGLSQAKLASDASLDRSYISLLERGIQSPTLVVLVQIATALSVRPSELIRRMEQNLSEAG